MAHAALMKVEGDESATCDKVSKLLQESMSLFHSSDSQEDSRYQKVKNMYESGYNMHAQDYTPMLLNKIYTESNF